MVGEMTTWTRQPSLIDGEPFYPHDVIAVGFGDAMLLRDGRAVWSEGDHCGPDGDLMTGAEAEQLAAADPDHDWRIRIYGPLCEAEWQRHGPGEWVQIARGEGFA